MSKGTPNVITNARSRYLVVTADIAIPSPRPNAAMIMIKQREH